VIIKVPIDSRFSYERTALHEAAETNQLALISLLLDCGADVDAVDRGSRTPLQRCSTKEAMEILLDGGASIEGFQEKSTLTLAAKALSVGYRFERRGGDELHLLKDLLSRGADVSHPSFQDFLNSVRYIVSDVGSKTFSSPTWASQEPHKLITLVR
jgi:Ankyrin repeats (3 copies)